ncbi:hypothetical protein H4Q26_018317 [Puccinia striiformis f. sp. tritici PST-130]|nr:hypothetical protein H4Q26_018317 [Puccinia striiformis f. sp. tritici PST-130]
MPSHLRNGRDLSGEQRRRDVEAGLSNIAGQRAVQRAQGKPSVPRTDANDQARNECRSNSDGGQLQGHVSCVKVGDVNPVPIPVDRLTVPPKDPSNLRQQTTGDVHKYVPLPVVHVRRSQENRRPSSHESRSESGDLEPGAHPTSPELRRDDGRVRELVSRSRDGHRVPQETSVQPLISSATQASTSTPSHQKGRSSPQEDVAMTYRGSYPGASNGSTSLIDLISPPDHSQLGVRTGSKLRAESRSSSRPARDERVELREPECDKAPALNFMPNAMNAQAPNFVQDVTNAPAQNFVPNYATQFQQNHNQSTFEHPRPPQHQQGLPATSHQAGPTSNNRRTIQTTVLEGTGTITAATNQQHPSLILLRSSAPPLTLFNASQVETQGDPGGEGGITNRKTTRLKSWKWEMSS